MFKCPSCGIVSHNPNDEKYRYCGKCHRFFVDDDVDVDIVEPRTCDQFVCNACGREIISLPARDPPPVRCATCTWLDEFIDVPEEAEALRRRLIDG